MIFSLTGKRVLVTGSSGLAGQHIVTAIRSKYPSAEILPSNRLICDLRNESQTQVFFRDNKPDVVIHAAGRVGGIHANNTYPAEFIYENLAMTTNVIHYAKQYGVEKLMMLGSSCIYPKAAAQPIIEEELLRGALEPTNEPYAIAKIAGIKMAQAYRRQYGCDFISIMPTNLYGPGDNYHPENSHVIAALISRFHRAKMKKEPKVVVWGTGNPLREFLYVTDFADACLFLLENYSAEEIVNVGSGREISIRNLALAISGVVGYDGLIEFDPSKPDGTIRKFLDNSKLTNMGWKPRISFMNGLRLAYEDYKARYIPL